MMTKSLPLMLVLLCLSWPVTCFSVAIPRQKKATVARKDKPRNRFLVSLASTSSSKDDTPPPSRLENILENAKSLSPFGNSKNDNDNDATIAKEASSSSKTKLFQASTAGLAVSLAMVPEAVAFAFVAGVSPLVGLWTTVVLGFTAASLGGRAGICSSASGACSVVVAALCHSHGPSYLSACAVLAGSLQILGGVLGLGKFIRLVPHPVMLGFVNGLAIVMTKAQLGHFRSTVTGQFLSLATKEGASVYGIAAVTMVLVKLLPKLTKVIPPSLGAVILSTILTKLLNLPIKTLADVAGAETFRGGLSVLPKVALPLVPFSWATLQTILPYAMTMAAVGCIESLLTLQLVDGMVNDGKRGSTSRECLGQGCGNVLSGLTGGIGGCALVGQSVINVQSGGGVSRWSGMSMALFLAIGIVAAAPLLGTVPVASLVGVMLLVCQSTFSWSSLRLWNRIPKLDAAVIALVSILTVQKDLAVAVVCGTLASALGFAWKESTKLGSSTTMEGTKKVYSLDGPLFFGSSSHFTSLFDAKSDPNEVVLDFTNSRVMDHSALKAIHTVADKYGAEGKTVYLRKLSQDCRYLLDKLYQSDNDSTNTVVEQSAQDPAYGVAVQYPNLAL